MIGWCGAEKPFVVVGGREKRSGGFLNGYGPWHRLEWDDGVFIDAERDFGTTGLHSSSTVGGRPMSMGGFCKL